MYNPAMDGLDHINIYSKGDTKLGRWLSNFTEAPFNHTKHGDFRSVEGYWYWRFAAANNIHDQRLRYLCGWKAKYQGKIICQNAVHKDRDFKEDVLEAIRCKIRQHKDWWKPLANSKLPFTHYYYFEDTGKVVTLDHHQWQIDEIERIRGVLREWLK